MTAQELLEHLNLLDETDRIEAKSIGEVRDAGLLYQKSRRGSATLYQPTAIMLADDESLSSNPDRLCSNPLGLSSNLNILGSKPAPARDDARAALLNELTEDRVKEHGAIAGGDGVSKITCNEWKTIPLRYVCQLNPPVRFDGLEEDDDLTFLPMDRIKNGYFIPNTDKLSKYASSYNAFEEGDIVLAKVTPCFENGNIAIAKNLVGKKGFGSSELFVVRPTEVVCNFLFYYLQSSIFKQDAEASMTGAGGLKRVSPDVLRQHHLPFPPEQTQRLIADYLDRETARIDALVAEKERMLALLDEKRAALISRAVTRGLDPDVRCPTFSVFQRIALMLPCLADPVV